MRRVYEAKRPATGGVGDREEVLRKRQERKELARTEKARERAEVAGALRVVQGEYEEVRAIVAQASFQPAVATDVSGLLGMAEYQIRSAHHPHAHADHNVRRARSVFGVVRALVAAQDAVRGAQETTDEQAGVIEWLEGDDE